jgi:hypothetical protein
MALRAPGQLSMQTRAEDSSRRAGAGARREVPGDGCWPRTTSMVVRRMGERPLTTMVARERDWAVLPRAPVVMPCRRDWGCAASHEWAIDAAGSRLTLRAYRAMQREAGEDDGSRAGLASAS